MTSDGGTLRRVDVSTRLCTIVSGASATEGETSIAAHLTGFAFSASTCNLGAAIAGARLVELAGVDVVEASVAIWQEGELARLRFAVVDVDGTRPEAGLVLCFDETHGGSGGCR